VSERVRPTLAWGDLAGARVGVWGLGVEGAASVARLATLGADAVLVDDRPSADGVVATAEGGLDLLRSCDAVVKAPGISRYRDDLVALEADGVPVCGGLGLWLQSAPLDRVVCITGTKGKSTTTSLLGHLLDRLGHRVVVGGNLGRPPWDPAVPGDADRWVVEVSSYQATDLAVSPPVVAVTSLHPDHLDWHGGVERYYADKLSTCTRPGAALTVAADVPELRERRALLGPEVRWVGDVDGDRGGWTAPFGLLGAHNRRNAEIARACLVALGEAAAGDPDALAALADGFEPLPSRLRLLRCVDGVDFVDDSLSTNVLPTIAAVDAFPGRRVALLVGGFDRGIDYAPLARHLAARTDPTLVLTLPDSGPRIAEAFVAAGVGPHVEVVDGVGVPEATATGYAWARPGGVVLLSPAAPSFGRYRDYRDRAEAFAQSCQRTGSSGT
jgi:UDP-N-acetylmuramoylalanine--D-glutamate ligase